MKYLPYLFQLQATRRVDSLGGVALLAMDMGTGKTMVSLHYAVRHPELFPIVVVCPKSVKLQWQRECKLKFGLESQVIESPSSTIKKNCPVTIVNYDILIDRKTRNRIIPGCLLPLLDLAPNMVIVDEVHALVSRKSKRTKAVKELCREVASVLALSGTPLTNRPSDLWSILNLLHPEIYKSFFDYGLRYCNGHMDELGYWNFKGASNLEELHQELEHVMIRIRKEDVIDQLPPIQRCVVPLDLPDRKEYDKELAAFIQQLKDGANREEQRGGLFRLKHLIGQAKLPLIIEWIDNFLEGGDGKLLLFGVHRDVVEPIYQHFKNVSVLIHGGITGADRQREVDRFQGDPSVRLCVGNLQAAGVGLTLTAAHDVAFAEIGWKPSDLTQAEQRSYARLNDMHGVNAWYLIAQNTIEERLLEVNQDKQQVANQVLDGGEVEDSWDVFDLLCQHLLDGK